VAGLDIGVVVGAIVADEEAFVLVRACRLVHGRGALHRSIASRASRRAPRPRRSRFVTDSPLEGTGFELTVPWRTATGGEAIGSVYSGENAALKGETGQGHR
jgi:hypothetical protein